MPPAPAERPPAAQASWATFARCRKRRYTDPSAAGKTGLWRGKARQGVLGSAVNGHWKKRGVTDWGHWENWRPAVNFAMECVVIENNFLSADQITDFAARAKGCEARGDCQQIVKEMEDLSLKQR
ncbi:hypothetical protein, partial [Photorhabdus sp. MH8.4]